MIVDNAQRHRWKQALTIDDGSSPPNEIVLRCIALMGEPDLVLVDSPPLAQGTRWDVVACSSNRLMIINGVSGHPGWTFRFMADRDRYAKPIEAEISASVHPLSSITSVSALQPGSENLYFQVYSEPGDDHSYVRVGWTLALRSGQEVELGPQFRYGAWQEKEAIAQRIVERVMGSWQ